MEMYKVLWIDDQNLDFQGCRTSFFNGMQLYAENWDIELVPFTNWEDGASELRRNINDYSAIILDAYCRLTNQGIEDDIFISAVLVELNTIFTSTGRKIPWYIFSAGTMEGFRSQIRTAEYYHLPEWGNMLYVKTAIEDSIEHKSKMFENIRRVAIDQSINVILHKHDDVFCLLGSGKVIDSEEARWLMRSMLSVLYYPEEFHNYEFGGNPIRKVIEHLFRSARDRGLLPEVFFNDNRIAMQWASRFMAGQTVEIDSNGSAVRWGNNEDSIFPKEEAAIVKNLLLYANVNSHTQEEDNNPWRIDIDKRYLFNAYLCSLCYIIKWYGEYVRKHKDYDTNLRNIREVGLDQSVEYNGIECAPEQDEEGVWHYKECYLKLKYWNPEHKMRLKEVQQNTGDTKDRYPFFARYDKLG